jgi:hypothetical protein
MLRKALAIVFITSVLVFTALALPPTVTIKEWDVPTPNSRPHDPAVAPDGSLWAVRGIPLPGLN